VLVLPWDSAVVAALAFGVGFVGGVILGLLA
jgi:hypothetical protein